MVETLGTGLPEQIERVRKLQKRYELLRRLPNVMVEPQIAMMESAIAAGLRALAGGDVVEMLAAYQDLKGWEE